MNNQKIHEGSGCLRLKKFSLISARFFIPLVYCLKTGWEKYFSNISLQNCNKICQIHYLKNTQPNDLTSSINWANNGANIQRIMYSEIEQNSPTVTGTTVVLSITNKENQSEVQRKGNDRDRFCERCC